MIVLLYGIVYKRRVKNSMCNILTFSDEKRRIFCAGKSVSSAALLGVMQGRDTKPGAKETSKTVLRKFPR